VQTDYDTTGVLFVDIALFGPVAIRRSAFHQVGQLSVHTCPDECANTALHDLSRRMWQQQFQVRAARLGGVLCAACVRLADGHGAGLSCGWLAQVGVLKGPQVAADVRGEPCGVPSPTPQYVFDAMRRAQVLFADAHGAHCVARVVAASTYSPQPRHCLDADQCVLAVRGAADATWQSDAGAAEGSALPPLVSTRRTAITGCGLGTGLHASGGSACSTGTSVAVQDRPLAAFIMQYFRRRPNIKPIMDGLRMVQTTDGTEILVRTLSSPHAPMAWRLRVRYGPG
jgi:hypothetical protein